MTPSHDLTTGTKDSLSVRFEKPIIKWNGGGSPGAVASRIKAAGSNMCLGSATHHHPVTMVTQAVWSGWGQVIDFTTIITPGRPLPGRGNMVTYCI